MSLTQPVHTDSLEEDHKSEAEQKVKNRKPANTAFRQQRLKAWQPILTPRTVLPLFFILGLVFSPIGGLLLWSSSLVQEIEIDYSTCGVDAPDTYGEIPSGYSNTFKTDTLSGGSPMWRKYTTNVTYNQGIVVQPGSDDSKNGYTTNTTVCSLQFEIPNEIGPPVLFYYRLTNFYQNHRRYVKSLDTNQLSGQAVSQNTVGNGTCDPLKLDPATQKIYYPCGLIANSLFNDTFSSPLGITWPNSSTPVSYNMTNKGIAWDSDAKLYGNTSYSIDQIIPPPYWAARWGPDGYTPNNPPPNLATYEEFQVWMRTAGLPAFSKLALRNDDTAMPAGTYQLDINLNFNVTQYGGKKSILITTRTVMGGQSPFLGIAYVVVGGLCVVIGIIFTVAHLIKPRKLGDHTYLTWNNDQPSSGTSTGIQRPGHDTA